MFGLHSVPKKGSLDRQSPPKTAVSRVPRGHGPGAFSFLGLPPVFLPILFPVCIL